MAAQKQQRSSRRPTGGRPGERSASRVERLDFRFPVFVIAHLRDGVLRRPIEFTLYVAEILGVQVGDLPRTELSHAPSYYVEKDLHCDFWFKIGDIRRLVSDDTPLVIDELKKLRNVHYNDRPVSIYGGMVDLPLVVTRTDNETFFDDDERDRLTDGRLWAEFDAGAGTGLGATERDLRENRFGDLLWLSLDTGTRTFIATGERIFREHRSDAAFDFAPVLSSFAKAMEVQGNTILRKVLAKLEPKLRMMNVDGSSRDLLEFGALDLGKLADARTPSALFSLPTSENSEFLLRGREERISPQS